MQSRLDLGTMVFLELEHSLSMEEDDVCYRCSNDSEAHGVCHCIQNAQVQLTVTFISFRIQGQVVVHNSVDVKRRAIISKRLAREDWKLSGVVYIKPIRNWDYDIQVKDEPHCGVRKSEERNSKRAPTKRRDRCPIQGERANTQAPESRSYLLSSDGSGI